MYQFRIVHEDRLARDEKPYHTKYEVEKPRITAEELMLEVGVPKKELNRWFVLIHTSDGTGNVDWELKRDDIIDLSVETYGNEKEYITDINVVSKDEYIRPFLPNGPKRKRHETD